MEESIKFCIGNVEGMEYIEIMHSINEACNNEEGEGGQYGKTLSSGTSIQLDNTSLLQAHICVLHNIEGIQPWIA